MAEVQDLHYFANPRQCMTSTEQDAAALANVPATVARHFERGGRLAASPLPFETPSFEVALVSHARSRSSATVQWAIAQLRRCWVG